MSNRVSSQDSRVRYVVDDPITNPVTSSGIVSQGEVYKEFLKKKFGVSGTDYDAAMITPVSEQDLLALGINPASASADQIARATTEIRLGRDLGLSPDQVKQAMAYKSSSIKELEAVMATDSPAAKTFDSDIASLKIERQSATSQSIEIGPPHPKMSMATFLGALIRALEQIMKAKASLQMADALTNELRLKDILTMTEQRIAQASAANTLQVENLRSTLKSMRSMRILMYTVQAVALAITTALAVAAVVASGGVAAPGAVIALAAVSVALASASTAVMIAANEKRRRGGSLLSSQGMQILTYTLMAAEIATSIGGGVVAAMAKQAAAKAAAKAAEKAAEKAVEVAAVEALKQAAKQAAVVAQKSVGLAVSQVTGGIGRIMSTRQALNMSIVLAKEQAESDYESSDQKKANDANYKKRVTDIQNNSNLTSGQKETQINQAKDQLQADHSSSKAAMVSDYEKSARKKEETLNWIMMGVMIGTSLGSMIYSLSSTGASVAASETEKMIMKIISTLQAGLTVGGSVAQADAQIQYQRALMDNLQNSLEVKRVMIMLDGIKGMYETLKDHAEELLTKGQESVNKSIQALSGAFDVNAQAMGAFTQRI